MIKTHNNNIYVVMYHYVRDSSSSKYPRIKSLDINDFISQIEYLQKHYQIISIEDFLFDNNSQNKKQCMLTFDDGYKEHHNIVMDILLNKGLKGCFFVTSDTVQNRKILDSHFPFDFDYFFLNVLIVIVLIILQLLLIFIMFK